jgi:hypothetical protein
MAAETHDQLEAVAILQYVVGRHLLVRDTHLWDLEVSLTCSQTCDAMVRTEVVTWTPEPALDLHNPPIAQDAYVYRLYMTRGFRTLEVALLPRYWNW